MKITLENQLFFLFMIHALLHLSPLTSIAQESSSHFDRTPVILGVNAYSFSDLLEARDYRNKEQVYTLFNLLDWCASQGIKALDPTAYFFPTYPEVPSDEYLAKFKKYAADAGVVISGTGIRNNFASPDPAVRAEGVQRAKNWIVAASKMGAPIVRVFAGEIPKGYEDKWEEPAQWMIDCYKELLPCAEKYGVKIGIQNHGEMLQTAEQCLYVLEKVDSEWAGLIVDTGNFKTADPYEDIAAVVPYAINWQVKESVFGLGSDIRTDFRRLIKIIKEGGYTGYLPIETLLVRGQSYDPFALVREMLDQLQEAIDAEYHFGEGYAFEQNRKLGRGVNIIGYDNALWQTPGEGRMKDKHFRLIKEAGFDNVRIVIMPFKFSMDEAYTIDPKFFITLDWAIEQALANDLMAIVDMHEHHAMQQDPLGNKAMFLAMWKQIAEHYQDAPGEVLFEIANEPNMNPEIWNEIHKDAWTILRKSNPDRTILIGPIYGNQVYYLKDLVLPEGDRNLIITVHYYLPIQFTHQGAPWSAKNKDLSGITWTNQPEEEEAIIKDFDIARDWSKTHNRPIHLGEFGAYDKADMQYRVLWTDFVARQAEARGWSWSYWQFDSDFIVYDIDRDKWALPIRNALIPKTK